MREQQRFDRLPQFWLRLEYSSSLGGNSGRRHIRCSSLEALGRTRNGRPRSRSSHASPGLPPLPRRPPPRLALPDKSPDLSGRLPDRVTPGAPWPISDESGRSPLLPSSVHPRPEGLQTTRRARLRLEQGLRRAVKSALAEHLPSGCRSDGVSRPRPDGALQCRGSSRKLTARRMPQRPVVEQSGIAHRCGGVEPADGQRCTKNVRNLGFSCSLDTDQPVHRGLRPAQTRLT